MSDRVLKIALIASIAVNLFAVATGVTLLVTDRRADTEIAQRQDRPVRGTLARSLPEGISPETRERVRDTLRQSALAASSDLRQARQLRREAIALASAEPFEPARVEALLAQSRAAELRGRTRLETDALALLGTLSPEERERLAPILAGRNGRREGPGRDGPRRERPERQQQPAQ